MEPRKLWFRRRLSGWGWYPSSREGWLVVSIYLVLVALLVRSVPEEQSFENIGLRFLLPLFILTLAVVRVCYKTGE